MDEPTLFPAEELAELLTLDEAAARLRKAPDTLRRWIKAGKFPPTVEATETITVTYRTEKKVQRVRSADVAAYLADRGPAARPADRRQAA